MVSLNGYPNIRMSEIPYCACNHYKRNFMMRSKETLQKIRESPAYRSMYREIIRTQIQTLIDQLANTGEESVLLTARVVENDATENNTVGTELGREFLNQGDVLCMFKEFCVKNSKDKTPVSQSAGSVKQNVNQPRKRKFLEMNGEDTCGDESSETEQTTAYLEPKRSRSLTPSLKLVTEGKTVFVPKGYSKCSLCNYMSKFKANVTRHERGVHRINLEGAAMVTAHYICGLCDYKSTYRSNLMRHEKSIHKISSTPEELESRKVHFIQNGNGSSFVSEDDIHVVQYETDTGNHTVVDEGNQLYMHQTGTSVENIGNKSLNGVEKEESDSLIKGEPGQLDTEIENQAVSGKGNHVFLKQNGMDMENVGNKSGGEPDVDECEEEENICHICNHCQELFGSESDLRKHVHSTHLNSGKLSFDKCDKAFDNDSNLEIHMTTHNAAKQEVCRCGKAFQYRTSLIRHERKCEFLTTSQGNSSLKEPSETTNTETSFPRDQNVSNKNVTENQMKTM
ncbi:zinc finger protein 845-like isoform X2 [Mercenaria mercenaria]|uniref:zinc finger protein 845-like isoform X2 n=1 Tax=Mercenaria mercenaria TaxID=6596 RepID=UPI00234ED662|nr:zinc finger protein 845-like isoform X2 [Mercenaria mercenaria]